MSFFKYNCKPHIQNYCGLVDAAVDLDSGSGFISLLRCDAHWDLGAVSAFQNQWGLFPAKCMWDCFHCVVEKLGGSVIQMIQIQLNKF